MMKSLDMVCLNLLSTTKMFDVKANIKSFKNYLHSFQLNFNAEKGIDEDDKKDLLYNKKCHNNPSSPEDASNTSKVPSYENSQMVIFSEVWKMWSNI